MRGEYPEKYPALHHHAHAPHIYWPISAVSVFLSRGGLLSVWPLYQRVGRNIRRVPPIKFFTANIAVVGVLVTNWQLLVADLVDSSAFTDFFRHNYSFQTIAQLMVAIPDIECRIWKIKVAI